MIQIPQGYWVTGPEAIDQRLVLTKQQMRYTKDEWMPEVYFCICSEPDLLNDEYVYRIYCYNKHNEPDHETGKFRPYTGVTYADLAGKPIINGVVVEGDHDGAYYNLLDALEGSEGIIIYGSNKVGVNADLDTIKINSEGAIYADLGDIYSKLDSEERAISDLELLLMALNSEFVDFRAFVDSEVLRLEELIDSESVSRILADSELRSLINSEALLRERGDSELRDLLDSEAFFREQADSELLRLIGLLDSEKQDKLAARDGIIIDSENTISLFYSDHFNIGSEGLELRVGSTLVLGSEGFDVDIDNETIILNSEGVSLAEKYRLPNYDSEREHYLFVNSQGELEWVELESSLEEDSETIVLNSEGKLSLAKKYRLPDYSESEANYVLSVDSEGHLVWIESGQPDWEENDSESPAFIKHRPAIRRDSTSPSDGIDSNTGTKIGDYTQAVASGNYAIANNWSSAYGDYSFTANYGYANEEASAAFNNGGAGGAYSFAVNNGIAEGEGSFAEGFATAIGDFSHAEGHIHDDDYTSRDTAAEGYSAHAEGGGTLASSKYSHAEGEGSTASGEGSHAEGDNTSAVATGAHAEGGNTIAGDSNSGGGWYAHAEGERTQALGFDSHAEGYQTTASGDSSHTEGHNTVASEQDAHAEGLNSAASGIASHAEGIATTASSQASHAEGDQTISNGQNAHAEGAQTTASGANSHAEGLLSQAVGLYSHAEGQRTAANGIASHAEGIGTTTEIAAAYSHTEGNSTVATIASQHVQGIHNVKDSEGLYADIVGWGTSSTKKNISSLTTTGDLHIKKDFYFQSDDDGKNGYKLPYTIVTETGNGAKTLALAKRDHIYIYTGTLTSLTITAIETTDAVTDIIFTAGASITVNLPAGVKKPANFTFEANKTYEINILHNLALIGTWE